MKFYPAWAEVNLHYLDLNIEAIQKEVGEEVMLAPVLKHDAFGHGAAVAAKRLMQRKKVKMFCLETVEECLRLRNENIELPLLLLSDFYKKDLSVILENDITVSVYNLNQVTELSRMAKKYGRRCGVQLRIDTGNEFDGISEEDFPTIYEEIRKLKNIMIDGVYTQVYPSYREEDLQWIKNQLEIFDRCVGAIPEKARKNMVFHAAGSECLYRCPGSYYNMVRPGLSMFFQPGQAAGDIRPIMKIKTRVESVFDVNPEVGSRLGRDDLDRKYRRVANLSIGWWDVCYLFMERDGTAMIRGKLTDVILSPQMDRVLIDVTEIPDAAVEDEAVLLGNPVLGTGAEKVDLQFRNFRRILHTGERLPVRYTNWSDHAVEFPAFALYHIRRELPKLDELLNQYGDRTMEQYIAGLAESVREMEALEPKEEVAEEVLRLTEPLFGRETALEASKYFLTENCLIPTGLHHGADFDAEQIQGNLIYYRYLQRRGWNCAVVPMLSCGGVDLSTSTYPRGIRCYSTVVPRSDTDLEVFRMPLFDNTYSNMVVFDTPPFTREMAEKMLEKSRSKETRAFLSEPMREAIERVIKETLLDEQVLAQETYAGQASLINRKIGRELIRAKDHPEFLYIQMEDVVSGLVQKDLKKETSLLSHLFFNPELRSEVLRSLDGETGCWTIALLKELRRSWTETGKRGQTDSLQHHGSCFFWGVGKKHRRLPLLLAETGEGAVLLGRDADEGEISIPFEAETLAKLLKERKLYPSVFLIMFSLKFVRGFALGGGCFQIEYTKRMKNGLVRALEKFEDYRREAEIIRRASDDVYMEGPMFGMVEDETGGLVQAGAVEMLARGGISENELHNVLGISFHDAAMIGSLCAYSEVFSQRDRIENWHRELAGGLEQLYGKYKLQR